MSRRCSVSVVICAYTEERWVTLSDAITEVRRQLRSGDELLVVVDHNEQLLERCGSALPGVVVVPNAHERGLSGARNTGVARARGDVVVFLDDDAVPEPGWLPALLAPYAHAAVAGVGGAALPAWGEGGPPRWWPEEFLWVVGCSYRGLPTGLAPVRNFIGANMSFRRDGLDHVGGFVEGLGRVGTLPMGCEETELAIRLRRARPGAVLLHEPAARVRHHVAPSRRSPRYFLRRCWSEGKSKAQVARLVGSRSALSSERAYVTRVLSAAVLRGLADTLRGHPSGLGRSLSVVVGLIVTTVGYLSVPRRRPQEAPGGTVAARPGPLDHRGAA